MKKIIQKIKFIALVSVVLFNLNIVISTSRSNNLNLLRLAKHLALGDDEWNPFDPPMGTYPKTEGCALYLGGGWVTASVERVCLDAGYYGWSSCTPVPCGEPF